jgi:hypothetical protein
VVVLISISLLPGKFMTAISFTPIGTIHIPYATQEGMPIQAVAYALAEIIPHQRSNSERMALDHYAASATAELR